MQFPMILLAAGLAVACVAWAAPVGRRVETAGAAYRVVEIDLGRDALEIVWKDDAGKAFETIDRLREWGEKRQRRLLFATNAGIYDREYRPLGLTIADGEVLRPLNTARGGGKGNFGMQPNGVFYVDTQGRAGVVPTREWRERGIDARLATQSGPMLLVDGAINPAFIENSDSRKWRSGVCAPDPGQVVFAVSEVPVTFHAFARLFRDALGCRDALYLDGTLSRIYTAQEGYAGAPPVMVKPYAAMFAVFGESAAAER